MTVQLNPYLTFDGTAADAMGFYQRVFGGELTSTTFAEFQISDDPADQDKLMHARLDTEHGLVLMGADAPASYDLQTGNAYSVSLFGDDEETLVGYWNQLSDGGTVSEPLERAPWGDSFGMCVDRFGISWMVNISGAQEG